MDDQFTLSNEHVEAIQQGAQHQSKGSSDNDALSEPAAASSKEVWHMAGEVQKMRDNEEETGGKPRKLGVTWQNLTVKGYSSGATFNENVISQFNLLRRRQALTPMRTIIDNSFGCVRPGEMLLVLGRPGSGCTTLLNMLSNNRRGYAEVSGDVRFGNLSAKEAEKYRGQIIMNTEEELFFPTLSVQDTINFAARMKVPYRLPSGINTAEEYASFYRDFLLRSVGISHTASTKVGDAYIRGVSGGERKRVSILECLSTRASVFCWDNSTRGLDASTALEWVKAIRAMTDVLGLTTIVTLYQASNGIYQHFDKVLVLDEGKQIFYGPQREAVPFMESHGFIRASGSNSADFLTGVTVPHERRVLPSHENTFPRNADEILAAYAKSETQRHMLAECSYSGSQEAADNTAAFMEMVAREKHKGTFKNSPIAMDFASQVKVSVIRQYHIMRGDLPTLILKQAATLVQSLIGGSLFYNTPDNSAGLFLKGGVLFFSIMYHSLISMSEVTDSFTGRPILAKHRNFALYHPAAICIAQIVTDIPILLFQVSHFSVVLYFMVGLRNSAAAFFTYFLTNFITAMSMTSFFRFIGAAFPTFDAATKVSGLMLTAYFAYIGYMIIKSMMHPWFVWLFWINPMAYGFEALLGVEFHDREISCVGPNVVPNGPAYLSTQPGQQSCAGIGGAVPGSTSVSGDAYLSYLGFSHSHVWRNIGIIFGWWVLFSLLTIFFTSRWKTLGEEGRSLLIPLEQRHKSKNLLLSDDESPTPEKMAAGSGSVTPDASSDGTIGLMRHTGVFTWKDLTYTVKSPGGSLTLLDNVQGYIKPGTLGALMGSSGAGKTTLLDVLAQRKTEGTISGSVAINGRPIPISFQRSAGYVEQLDVHEPLATVREALEFSALLRQSRDTPTEEKLRYVDTIIDLLELHDLEHTLVGSPGSASGLSVEQRKRLTIAVELVAKPSLLLFLDEPTSGLDGQAAYNTVRFLRKLSMAGQAVLVTIHQPSAQLFSQFDTLLLLSKGGKTVYFGEIGNEADTIKAYFARNGAPCPPETNPAEHMIDVVSGSKSASNGRSWHDIWLNSPEHNSLIAELDSIITDGAANPAKGHEEDGHEFAASMWTQLKLVTHRMNISLFRNTEYINNKFALHISLALFNGFSFWMINDSLEGLQENLFTVLSFIFVAPGVISQLQPLFIDRRDLYETREKKSKMYHWAPFVAGLIISEFPYLIISAVLYYVCWYFTAGLPSAAKYAGPVFFLTVMWEFLYTAIGQAIAAYAPNAVFAALVNPVVITTLVACCGVMVPYSQIQVFWRYWMYYIDPFNYMMSSLLVFTTWSKPVKCKPEELAIFDPPVNQTCAEYLTSYQQTLGFGTNLLNPEATTNCRVCSYTEGSDYLKTLNLKAQSYGWRNAGIVVAFVIGIYGLVFLMMKLRTKATKKAES